MEKVERINATMQVVTSVKNAIQNGSLSVGNKLPREADMAKELGVGRSSLREGMKILAAYGVVESRQGEGTYIVDNRARNFFEFMGFLPSKENFEYFMELRRVLETGNIITIYDRLEEKEFEILEPLVEILDQRHPVDVYVEADRKFHTTLISYTQNPMIIQINNMISAMREDLLYNLFSHKEIVADARDAHRKIFEALKKRDLIACIDAVTMHIDTTKNRINRIY